MLFIDINEQYIYKHWQGKNLKFAKKNPFMKLFIVHWGLKIFKKILMHWKDGIP